MGRFETVEVNVSGAVAHVALNRPKAYNAFDAAMRGEASEALWEVAANDDVRVVVLSGRGKGFCAGADLKEGIVDVQRALNESYRPSFDAIMSMDKPVISAVNGPAAGIGLSLALVCDLTVMGESAYLLSPFSTISLVPDGGANWLLIRQLGYKQAYAFAVEAERMPAARALELGLVNRVVPDDAVLDEALAWAGRLAERAPLSLAATKRVMRKAMHASYDEVFRQEAAEQPALLDSDDCREGVDAFFEKREPGFRGR
ncbi:MAG: enoyl-CoA hydratase-related protein [Pseudomonadota bacterium]